MQGVEIWVYYYYMNNPFESFNKKNNPEILDPQTELEQSALLFRAYEVIFKDVIQEGEKLKQEFLHAPTIDDAIRNPELMDQTGDSTEDIKKKLKERIKEANRLKDRLKQLVDEVDKLSAIIPNNPQDN